MRPVFADTFFFIAILNRADPLHQRAVTATPTTLRMFGLVPKENRSRSSFS